MRLGVFGGTFDPPHVGHLIVAQDTLAALRLDRVLFVPARLPPHKREKDVTSAETRLEMVRAAVRADDRFEASDLELGRSGPSYTVDTLRELHERNPSDHALFFLMGTDQFAEFHTWREPETIARLARIIVLSRGGAEEATTPLDVAYEALPVTRIDVSSTDVRQRVRNGAPIRYLVPEAVEGIIRREALYRARVGSAVGEAE